MAPNSWSIQQISKSTTTSSESYWRWNWVYFHVNHEMTSLDLFVRTEIEVTGLNIYVSKGTIKSWLHNRSLWN